MPTYLILVCTRYLIRYPVIVYCCCSCYSSTPWIRSLNLFLYQPSHATSHATRTLVRSLIRFKRGSGPLGEGWDHKNFQKFWGHTSFPTPSTKFDFKAQSFHICYPKAHSWKSESTFFPIFYLKRFVKVVTMQKGAHGLLSKKHGVVKTKLPLSVPWAALCVPWGACLELRLNIREHICPLT
jgi:hypothetical protein